MLPGGTVTFLFTDIENSTRLLQQLGDGYVQVLDEHRRIVRAAARGSGGWEVDTQGDAFFVAFGRAIDAVTAAVAAQRELAAHPWPEGGRVRVRMGLHTGEPIAAAEGYVGLDVHRAARLCAAGHGGQVLLSQATRNLVEEGLPAGLELRDLGEHRLKDLRRPERVVQVVIPGLPADFPPPRTLDTLPNNLPRQLTSFVGREREIAQVKRLLEAAPLVTLTGSGGAGKTRLGLQVAADLADTYPDGVWLVELAALADPTLVPRTAASVLGLVEAPRRRAEEVLADYLRLRSLLLVLDNCEHLIAACAGLVAPLLRECPGLRVLATSREPLGIAGETTWRVPSLAAPDLERLPPVDQLPQYEAVRLFIDRAMAALPSFTVTNANAPAVAQVCHRLDGLPLAIELAAARVKALAVEQIAARLDRRLRLLTGGGRDALPRQQTLRATVDWSYELLTAAEQALLRRLSVFAGGWTLEAAESICIGGEVEEEDVLDLLARLVDKSLVLAEDLGGEERYRLLETVREYAHERLLEGGEAPTLRDKHLDWLLALAEEVEPKLDGPEQATWFERLETEHDNFRAALDWSRSDASKSDAGLRLAGALTWFWTLRAHLREAAEHLTSLLALSPAPTAARARALVAAGWIAYTRGDAAAARSHLEEGLTLFRRLENAHGTAVAMAYLGRVMHALGDAARATELFDESRVLFESLGGESGLDSPIARYEAEVALHAGDYERAQELYEASLAQSRERGDRHGITHALRGLAQLAWIGRDGARAVGLLEESLAILRDLKDKRCAAQCVGALARATAVATLGGLGAAGAAGPERAARLFGAAEAAREAIGTPLPAVERAGYEQDLAALRARLDDEAFAAAWAEGRAMTLEQAVDAVCAADKDARPVARPAVGVEPGPEASPLTPREREVAILVARGLSNRQIADELVIAERTVHVHIGNILGKLGFRSRAQVAAWAVERGLA